MDKELTRWRLKVSPVVNTKSNASFKIKEARWVEFFLLRASFRIGPVGHADLSECRNGDEKFVLKEIPRNNYEFRLEIYKQLGQYPYVRGLEDTAPNHSIFIFKYLKEHLLGLAQKNLPIAITKKILKDALRGLAAMHDKDIVHNGKHESVCFSDS
jgi:hypothetical protein